MISDFPRGTARAIKGAAWLGLAGIGVIAASCGGDGSTGSGGAGVTSSSADTTSTTTSASSSGGAGPGSSSSSSGAGGTGGATSSSSSGAGGSGGAGGGVGHLADWVRTFLGSEQSASSVSTDAQGNIYVGGTFASGPVDFGAGQHDCPFMPGGPSWCGFLLKLDPTGKTLWSRAFAGDRTLSIDVPALAADAGGVVIAARWNRFQFPHGPLDVGTGPLDPPGDNPMVLARFDPSGTALWSAAFGVDAGEVIPASVVIDGPSSFLVGGTFSTASLDLGAGPMPLAGATTIFLGRFNGMTLSWQKSFGGKFNQDLSGFGRGPGGNLLLAGSFEKNIDFGGGALHSQGTWALYQATLDASGGFVANQKFDGSGTFPNVSGVAADAAGNTLMTGLFDATLTIGAAPLVCQGNVNGYLAKIDAQGQVAFAQATTEPATSIDGSFCIAADASNNLAWGADLLFAGPSGDTFQGRISKLDPSGAVLWSVAGQNFGARGFAFDPAGNVIAVGVFSTQIDFAKGGPILGTMGRNAFVAKFTP